MSVDSSLFFPSHVSNPFLHNYPIIDQLKNDVLYHEMMLFEGGYWILAGRKILDFIGAPKW